MMATNERNSISIPAPGGVAIFACAALLIVLGIVLQSAELGYGHLRPDNLWLVSVIGTGIWNMLAAHSGVPGFFELLQFWPLLLVTLGLGIFLVKR
ncbi:MAG: hypothetical protein ACRD4S_10085 [Candidatus Acidiferrales bacterium]